MLSDINLISNRKFKIRNFEEDKNYTLKANSGLRYNGIKEGFYEFSGNFYLKNVNDELIESFGIILLLPLTYPNSFPSVFSVDGKIDKRDVFHISNHGEICVEHTYIANKLVSGGLRLYDFIEYYLPKYFSWVLLKQCGLDSDLKEWGHHEKGTIQLYEQLLNINDPIEIKRLLESYLSFTNFRRNDECFCGSEKKLKKCHLQVAQFLKSTPQKDIKKDITLLN